MALTTDPLDDARTYADMAKSNADASLAANIAAVAQAFATIALVRELRALRQTLDGLKGAVTDTDGFSSADHLRNINDWVERIAKS
ncbi:hypothetical protein ACFT9M_03830 [Micromonospora purpureochromogenes]|uniref:hypothetical protein n=1 Tax=Micromonospora purpureochromogenes TaxID=47872 RepID=UPI0036283799